MLNVILRVWLPTTSGLGYGGWLRNEHVGEEGFYARQFTFGGNSRLI